MARAMWKGSLVLGPTRVPIKLYSAAQDRAVRFRLLHGPDGVPVRQRMVDASSNDEVPGERTRRGLEVEPGVYVILGPDDLASVEPEPSRDIEIARFVPTSLLGPEWYDRPYWLGPDGSAGPYFALARALADQARDGVAHWVMRKHRYTGVLRESNGYLALVTLRSASEIDGAQTVAPPKGKKAIDPKEQKLAAQLVAALESEFDPAILRDEHAERVREFALAKAGGKKVRLVSPTQKRATRSLTDALTKSIARAKEKQVA